MCRPDLQGRRDSLWRARRSLAHVLQEQVKLIRLWRSEIRLHAHKKSKQVRSSCHSPHQGIVTPLVPYPATPQLHKQPDKGKVHPCKGNMQCRCALEPTCCIMFWQCDVAISLPEANQVGKKGLPRIAGQGVVISLHTVSRLLFL